MKFIWTPEYSAEEGIWYCQKMVYMCPAEIKGEFKTEGEAMAECKKLNEIKVVPRMKQ